MRFETWEHVGVTPTGNIIEKGEVVGNVHVESGVTLGEGCGVPACQCSEGLWLSMSAGRDATGTVRGSVVWFHDRAEMARFLDSLALELVSSPLATLIQ